MDESLSSLRAVVGPDVGDESVLAIFGGGQQGQTTSTGLGTKISPASINPTGTPNYIITGGTWSGDGPNQGKKQKVG